jgi:hypothetical protein
LCYLDYNLHRQIKKAKAFGDLGISVVYEDVIMISWCICLSQRQLASTAETVKGLSV